MASPAISIIMPTRGRVELVRRAVGSVLAQTLEDYELWILDNSPKTEAGQIVEISKMDPRIRFVDREGIGVSEARELGVRKARGKFLCFLDSDDYWASGRLKRHMDIWIDHHLGLSWDSCEELGGLRKLVPQPFHGGPINPPRVARMLYLGNFIHASSGFMRTSYAREIDFSWSILSDWVIFMKMAEDHPAFFIDEVLSFRSVELADSVSREYSTRFFFDEAGKVRKRMLLANPFVYFPVWAERSLSRLRKRIAR